jgi:hypothetical protein
VSRDAESVLTQLDGWFADYNTQALHGALGLRSPAESGPPQNPNLQVNFHASQQRGREAPRRVSRPVSSTHGLTR